MADELLVASAKEGQHAAFAELCRRHRSMALRVIQRITRNREDAEDALQDTFCRAFVHLRAFDGRSSYSTWFTRIAINSALMVLRKKRAAPAGSLEEDAMGYQRVPHPGSDPERSYLQWEREHAVRRAVQRLPPVLRSVAEIRYGQESSVCEVAEQMGISVAAAKSRLMRARRSLHMTLSRVEGMGESVA